VAVSTNFALDAEKRSEEAFVIFREKHEETSRPVVRAFRPGPHLLLTGQV
jgi:hypothetical protein